MEEQWSWKGVRAEARTVELHAVAQLGRAAARSPVPPCRRAPPRAPPPQHPARRRMAAASSAVALRGGGGRPTSRCGAAPVHLRAPYAHAVRTVPKPVLRAGARVATTAPAPSSTGRSSAIIAGLQASFAQLSR